MKRNLVIAFVVAICILAVIAVFLRHEAPVGEAGRVAVADNRDFFPVLHSLLASAESSVDVILYQSRFYFHYPMSASNTLLSDLSEAAARGAKVRVILERADWNLSNTEENRDVWHILRDGNIEVYFDPDTTTSHSKLVIIDDRYVVMGSTNWSHYSLDNNNEANVIMDSKGVAGGFKAYFDDVVSRSSTEFVSSITPMAAADLESWEDRYVLLYDVADSARYDGLNVMGMIYFGDVVVGVADRPLEEILSVDSLFFARAAGESVRVMGRFQGANRKSLEAIDVELKDTPSAMARAFESEKSMLRKKRPSEPAIDWIEGARIYPAANRDYASELRELFRSAETRIWAALADARYYERTPDAARKQIRTGQEASLTNMLLGELVSAAVSGVEVRFVFDMGWSGSPPATKVAFLERLAAGGGEVYQDTRDVTTHAKLLIVDDDYVVVGSTNWSYHAFEESNETSVIIQSRELNQHYADYIESIIEAGTLYE